MASIRKLKKEVNFLSPQVIADCFDLKEAFAGKENEAMDVIAEIIVLHNSTLDKINHPDGKDNPKLVKAFYRQSKQAYADGINKAYESLAKLVQ